MRICVQCGKEFEPKKQGGTQQKYCCSRCKYDREHGGAKEKERAKVIAHDKVFDLEVGDMVLAPDNYSDNRKTHKFKVTKIFPNIFECKRIDTGALRYFTKSSQIMGEVKRI